MCLLEIEEFPTNDFSTSHGVYRLYCGGLLPILQHRCSIVSDNFAVKLWAIDQLAVHHEHSYSSQWMLTQIRITHSFLIAIAMILRSGRHLSQGVISILNFNILKTLEVQMVTHYIFHPAKVLTPFASLMKEDKVWKKMKSFELFCGAIIVSRLTDVWASKIGVLFVMSHWY